jgi:hypothetical protein
MIHFGCRMMNEEYLFERITSNMQKLKIRDYMQIIPEKKKIFRGPRGSKVKY